MKRKIFTDAKDNFLQVAEGERNVKNFAILYLYYSHACS